MWIRQYSTMFIVLQRNKVNFATIFSEVGTDCVLMWFSRVLHDLFESQRSSYKTRERGGISPLVSFLQIIFYSKMVPVLMYHMPHDHRIPYCHESLMILTMASVFHALDNRLSNSGPKYVLTCNTYTIGSDRLFSMRSPRSQDSRNDGGDLASRMRTVGMGGNRSVWLTLENRWRRWEKGEEITR